MTWKRLALLRVLSVLDDCANGSLRAHVQVCSINRAMPDNLDQLRYSERNLESPSLASTLFTYCSSASVLPSFD
jgi:hypothetical protein